MNFFKKIFHTKRAKQRLDLECNICGVRGDILEGNEYNQNPEKISPCDMYNVINISSLGLALRHKDTLKKGDILRFHTKQCIKDEQCFSCPNYSLLDEKLLTEPMMAKVVWRNNFMAGCNITAISEKERVFLENLLQVK